MGEESELQAAAARHDWQGCERIMFAWLYGLNFPAQMHVSEAALGTYRRRWMRKHGTQLPLSYVEFLPLESNLDHADAEYESGVLEFERARDAITKKKQTTHFANAIRSAVIAVQFDTWMQRHAAAYENYKQHKPLAGQTFTQDRRATLEAKATWLKIDKEFARAYRGHRPNPRLNHASVVYYLEWDKSLL